MSREGLKKRERRSKASQLVRFLRREGKKYCAVALCASLIAGNIGNMAVAADDGTGSDYEFELDRVSLYEALQEAVAEDNTVDKDFEFAGEAADTYESLLEADGTLYELKPEIEDNHGALNLRIFARLEGEIEFDSAYEIDGSEEMIFLLTNTSDKEKTAVIRVDDKVTEQINVAPKNAVLSSEQASAYKSAAELFAGPGAMDETSAAADNGIMISGGSGSSGGGGSSGGSGGSGGGSKVEVIDESDMETESGKVDGENDEDRADDASEAEQASEAGDHKDEENQAEESHDGSETGDEADKGEGSDHTVVDSSDSGADITIDTDIDQDRGSTDVKEDSDVKVGEADQADDSDKVDSGNENSGNVDSDDAEIGDNSSDEEAADDKLAAAISYHETYLVTATPSDADEDEASPSDATDSNADKNTLDGMVYETVLMDKEAVVAFATTFEDLNLSNLLALEASMSNAGRMHVTDLGDLTVQVWVKNGILPEDAKLQVTRLREDDETADQYQKAREALDAVGTQYSGMMALDIVFVDAEDQEIEPDGNVQVSIKMNQDVLPEDVNLESITVHHLKEEGAEIIVQSVADVTNDTTGNIDFQKSDAIVAAEFEVDSFSPFTITWNDDFKITVHYVNVEKQELTELTHSKVDLTEDNITINASDYSKPEEISDTLKYSGAYYWRDDIRDGFEFDTIELSTYENWSWNEFKNVKYRKVTFKKGSTVVGEIQKKDSDRLKTFDIYLMYKTVDIINPPEVVGKTPGYEKTAVKNDAGNYDLNLSVSGSIGSATEKAKLDMLFILDISSSMNTLFTNSQSRMKKVTESIKILTDTIYANSENIDSRFSLVSFSDVDDNDAYDTKVQLDWSELSLTRNGTSNNVYDVANGLAPHGGTNYQAGIAVGKSQLRKARSDAQTVVVFLTDGAPTYHNGANKQEGSGDSSSSTDLANAVAEIEGMGCSSFYAIGVGDETGESNLKALVNAVNVPKENKGYYVASDTDLLTKAFEEITSNSISVLCDKIKILDRLSDLVKVIDGIPELTIIDGNGDPVKDKEGNNIDHVPGKVTIAATAPAGKNVKDEQLKPIYNSKDRTLQLEFSDDYMLEPNWTYMITLEIDATEADYMSYRSSETYPNTGELGTGTHASERGYYSNAEAILNYHFTNSESVDPNKAVYKMPVIQIHPNQLIIKKTISGLKDDLTALSSLEKNLGFQVKMTWANDTEGGTPTKTTTRIYYVSGETEIKEGTNETIKSFVTRNPETGVDENGNVTYVITVNNLSPNTECEITEIGREVDGYTCITNAGVIVKDKTESTEPSANLTTLSVNATANKDKVISAMFTNTYSLAVTTLKVKKIVDGNMGDRDKKFTFTVSLKKGDESIDLPDTVSATGVDDYATDTDVNTGKKCATFSLSHNGNNEIELKNLPIGSELIIKETNEDYGVKVTQGTNELAVSKTEDSASVNVLLGTTNEMVTFTNTKTAEIDAGVILDSLPYVLILAAAIGGAAFYFIRKKKDDESDLD